MDTPRKKITSDQEQNNSYCKISGSDSELYDFVDSNLKKENVDGFSLGFPKNIIRKIEAKQQRRFNQKIYCLISILVLMCIPFFLSFLTTEFIAVLFSLVLKYKFVFTFLIIIVISIQYGEKFINAKKDLP